MMRCLGAAQVDIFAINAWQFLVLGAAGCAAGTLAGFGAQAVLAHWLAGFFSVALPRPGWRPAVQGAVIGLVLRARLHAAAAAAAAQRADAARAAKRRRGGRALEPRRLRAGPGRALRAHRLAGGRREAGRPRARRVRDRAGRGRAGGLRADPGPLPAARRRLGPWRYGLANLRRRTGASLVQVMALGVGIMAMLLLTLVRTDLIAKWQKSMPADMPNRFAINIQTRPAAAREALLRRPGPRHARPLSRWCAGGSWRSPGARSSPADFKDERAKRLVEREFNLSWAEKLRPDNRIVAGAWWKPGRERAAVLGGGGHREDARHPRRRHAHLGRGGLALRAPRSRACARWSGTASRPTSS